MKIRLTQDEYAYCSQHGAERTRNNRAHNVKTDQRGTKTHTQYDVFGALGEFAFCKLFGVPFDGSIGVRSGGADTYLCGVAIDVKSTDLSNGRLLANMSSLKHPVDVFVLMTSQNGYVWNFVGWAASDELLRTENIMQMSQNYPRVFALPQSRLHKPDDFLPWISANQYLRQSIQYMDSVGISR